MPRRPRIGLTLELTDPIIAKVDARMREVIEGAGGLAVVIPHSADPESWQAAYETVDAVVMIGGPDVAAEHYGATPHALTAPGHPGIDATDLGLARACLRDGKPVLGICRGAQVLNVAAGGTLVQDVPSTGTPIVHMGEWIRVVDDPPSCYHEIEVLPGTRLADWLGAGKHVVNSYTIRPWISSATGCARRPSRRTARSRRPSRPTAPTPSACSGTTSSTCARTSATRARCRPSSRRRARSCQGERRAARPPRRFLLGARLLQLLPAAVGQDERRDQREVGGPRPVHVVGRVEEPDQHEQNRHAPARENERRHGDRTLGDVDVHVIHHHRDHGDERNEKGELAERPGVQAARFDREAERRHFPPGHERRDKKKDRAYARDPGRALDRTCIEPLLTHTTPCSALRTRHERAYLTH